MHRHNSASVVDEARRMGVAKPPGGRAAGADASLAQTQVLRAALLAVISSGEV